MDKKRLLGLVLIQIIVYAIAFALGLKGQQLVAVMIIALLISATFLFWANRLAFGFLGVASLFAFNVLNIKGFIEFANVDIIIFLIGMMIIVGFLENRNFFEYLIGKIIKKIGHHGNTLLITVLVLSAVSAALVDEVTSILIMTAIVLHLTSEYKVNPIPFVLMTVFATNIGSSATVVGNPVGVMVALKGGLSFTDFLRWATPISAICLLVAIGLILLIFRKDIKEFSDNVHNSKDQSEVELESFSSMKAPTILFSLTLLGLIFHTQIEKFLHLEKNAMLIGVALIGAGIALILAKKEAPEIVEQRVDWWTLVFFMFLFASVGSLERTGVIEIISDGFGFFADKNPLFLFAVMMLATGILSAMLDNVLAVAIMIPVVENLMAAQPAVSGPLWWILLFAGTLFGNLTFIGSTANIVALGVLQKRHYGSISFMQWFKPGFVIVAITSIIAFILIALQAPFM